MKRRFRGLCFLLSLSYLVAWIISYIVGAEFVFKSEDYCVGCLLGYVFGLGVGVFAVLGYKDD